MKAAAYSAAIAMLLGAYAGWTAAQWHRDSQVLADAIRWQAAQAEITQLAADLDRMYTDKREALKRENNDIVRDVDAGRIRLHIPATTVSTCTSATSLGNGTGSADTNERTITVIESDTAAKIIALTARGDDAIAKLNVLHDYIQTVCLRNN